MKRNCYDEACVGQHSEASLLVVAGDAHQFWLDVLAVGHYLSVDHIPDLCHQLIRTDQTTDG